MNDLENIRDFLRIDDRLATSGMPRPDHFAAIGRAGYDVVINLALPTSDDAIRNEGELVSREGMTYVHIPVKFDSPTPATYEAFARVMDACENRRVFVHCVANKRVSAFVFLYRTLRGHDRTAAERDLHRLWDPEESWKPFINAVLSAAGHRPL